MRTRKGLVLALMVALSVAGCGYADDGNGIATGGGTAKATGPAADRMTDKERAVKFGRCMRENGVPDFPDPDVEGGGVRLRAPEGMDKKKVDAAMEKCKQYLPNAGEPPPADPKRRAQMLKYAQCMREHGVPKFPDPDDDGRMQINSDQLGMPPDDPRFKAAEKECAKLRPAPPSGGPGPETDRTGG
ncbi:MAG: hypothetical protein ACRDT4_11270 [Micromonosporaceae bacterium]